MPADPKKVIEQAEYQIEEAANFLRVWGGKISTRDYDEIDSIRRDLIKVLKRVKARMEAGPDFLDLDAPPN